MFASSHLRYATMIQAISVRFTYDTTTPESCELGDFSDTGFCNELRQALTTREDDLQAVPDCAIELWETFGDLEYLIRCAIDLGIHEPSASRISSHCWFSSVDPDVNYSTGEETRYNLHIRGLSDEQMQGIADILSQGYIDEENEYWLECLERDINAKAFLNSLPETTLQQLKVTNAALQKPETLENLLLTLCSNHHDLVSVDNWTVANELYGLYKL